MRPGAERTTSAAPARRGFTLIELMIVVAIISILASIAIPNFLRFQLMSRRSEMFINLKGITVSELAYESLYEQWVDCDTSPQTPLDRTPYTFDSTLAGWEDLGWAPDGKVRCHYGTTVFSNSNGSWVRAITTCDLDNDNAIATYWMDVDRKRTSGSSQHMKIRPNPATAAASPMRL